MKTKNKTHLTILTLSLLIICSSLFGQVRVRGSVMDKNTDRPLAGVRVLVVENIEISTITDIDGNFTINVEEIVPFTLSFVLDNYHPASAKKIEANSKVNVRLTPYRGDILIEGTSRVEESILESPITIERLDANDLRHGASADYYDELSRLKGVYNVQASRNFNSINARGFGPHGNIRFVQLIDGMDNVMPSLNFSTGSINGVPELDIESIELIPGASSALYGPNAFNGILINNTKNPFEYRGLSAHVKTGFTKNNSVNAAPFYDMGIRYAQSFADSFAFKFNFSMMEGDDWVADNYDEHFRQLRQDIANASPGDPDFNGINLYGDDFPIDSLLRRRTGWKEVDLLGDDYKIKSLKFDIALHYRITKNLEAVASYKYGQGTTIYQSNARYVLRNFPQQFFKLELNSIKKWNIRAYRTTSNQGDSYNLSALGAIVNEALLPSNVWVGLYNGFEGDPNDSRGFADGEYSDEMYPNEMYPGIPREAHDTVTKVIENIKNTPLTKRGAAFIDDSKLNHIEGNYNLSELCDNQANIQIGGNWRQYNIFSDGTIFNEPVDNLGNFKSIKINEYGVYLQASKKLVDSLLKLTGSVRFDKSRGFDGQFSPRISVVYSTNDSHNHNFRASYQKGFRNPTAQERYLYFNVAQEIFLGGTRDNAERYGIYEENVLTLESHLAGGEDSIMLNYVQPEKLQSIDVGYKGVFASGAGFIDINAYYNTYKDFIVAETVVSIDTAYHRGVTLFPGTSFRPFFNAPPDAQTFGITAGIEYTNKDDWKFEGNYSYNTFLLGGTGFGGFENGFNAPKHRVNLGISNRKLLENLSFSANLRWQNQFDWVGLFGTGKIPSYYTIDTQIGYRIPKAMTAFKFGVNNLTGNNYITNYGGARIGRVMYFGIIYDESFTK